jgi:orotidine-5'-phosphate decarboxylase
MPDSVFLVPGFGAQGRSLEQVAACFRADGSGAVVNSSRGVINAYEEPQYVPPSPEHWPESVRRACRDLVDGVSKMRASGHNP